MNTPTHTCTSDTCWTEHARDERGRSRCLHRKPGRLGKGNTYDYCGLPGAHRYDDDGTPHEYTIRLGPSPERWRLLRGIAIRSAAMSATAGLALGALLAVVTR